MFTDNHFLSELYSSSSTVLQFDDTIAHSSTDWNRVSNKIIMFQKGEKKVSQKNWDIVYNLKDNT